ncbi:unnamed protein product [Heligmosomoides polygyrus]|uniref:GOLD domain-containing protein n=1 Tax=Heligmosomoides polygyrus TaxID=6339 RepID=A0A183FD81_HELPZ|nr:unnamed protein product [Heligmosomoides polygyrus]
MKAVLCVAVQLLLCIGATALVNLDDSDMYASFLVHDKDFNEVDNVFFAGKQKDEKAVTFIYTDTEMIPIDYSMYYLYLGCEIPADDEEVTEIKE